MKPMRKISRRSFLARVGAGSFLTLTGCITPYTDADPWDPVGGGGGRGRGGYTDADTGSEGTGRESVDVADD